MEFIPPVSNRFPEKTKPPPPPPVLPTFSTNLVEKKVSPIRKRVTFSSKPPEKMLSFVGLRIAAFGQPVTSNGVGRILVGPVIVRFPPTPLAICPTPSVQSPIANPALAPSSSACLRAVSHPPPHLPLHYSTSPGAAWPASNPKPICISALAHSPPPGACLCVSESTTMPPLPVFIEADLTFSQNSIMRS